MNFSKSGLQKTKIYIQKQINTVDAQVCKKRNAWSGELLSTFTCEMQLCVFVYLMKYYTVASRKDKPLSPKKIKLLNFYKDVLNIR